MKGTSGGAAPVNATRGPESLILAGLRADQSAIVPKALATWLAITPMRLATPRKPVKPRARP